MNHSAHNTLVSIQTVSDQVGKWFPKEHLLPHPVALEFSNDAVELDIPHSSIAAQGYQIIPGRSPCKVGHHSILCSLMSRLPSRCCTFPVLYCAYFEMQIRQVDVQLGMCIPTVTLTISEVSFSQGILQCDLAMKGTTETWTFPLLVTHPASRKEALGS